MAKGKKIRVLVVDDSAYNRRAIMEMLESVEDIAVIGTAADGEEGLKVALALKPDAITLDLDMPNMDGFTFLRLLRAQAPVPVIVISGYARTSDVFKALELGAIDFIAKPSRHFSPETKSVREELVQKLGAVRLLRRRSLGRTESSEVAAAGGSQMRVAVVGASTGGPPALQRLLSSLSGDLPLGIAIAQHMPERFTRAFAERLNRLSAYEVVEARSGDLLAPGRALIAPGGHTMRLVRTTDGLRAGLSEGTAKDRYVPSIDALFESVAHAVGAGAAGVLLTGMGNDGCAGMLALKKVGAITIAESEETAVIYGMPKEAVEAGAVKHVLALDRIPDALTRFARGVEA
ncbi:MAG: chemotaxis-specific protein-glutamate methyltransferase CheB [Deltaproteobacteria bacterium]|nr:chemotaxis-specific protein-glutamate methyltransferase CheB [Deltaproteobacteria bacterium]